jgi:hypothetical protein
LTVPLPLRGVQESQESKPIFGVELVGENVTNSTYTNRKPIYPPPYTSQQLSTYICTSLIARDKPYTTGEPLWDLSVLNNRNMRRGQGWDTKRLARRYDRIKVDLTRQERMTASLNREIVSCSNKKSIVLVSAAFHKCKRRTVEIHWPLF